MIFTRFLLLVFTFISFYSELGAFDRKQVFDAFKKIESQELDLKKEIEELRKLLGLNSELEELTLKAPHADMSKELKEKVEKATEAYNKEKYDEAKKLLREAWEMAPDDHVVQYNLGLSYQKLGNEVMAKKMLRSAIEAKPALEGADKIQAFLEGAEEKNGLDAAASIVQNEIQNLKKEADSYLKSSLLDYPQKMKAVLGVLAQLEEKLEKEPRLKRDNLLEVAKFYASFEWYEKSLELFRKYEEAMEGRVLPDTYYTQLLQNEERAKKQKETLATYAQDDLDPKQLRKFSRDLEELKIFASQFDEFVRTPNTKDPDFVKISNRLKEFRWGKYANRHVIVVNRYQEILYSSLPGTLPLDRYQDQKGRLFLKDLLLNAKDMKLGDAKVMGVNLKVGKDFVPYAILFTYIPKHESFIVVRIPRVESI